MTQTARRTEIVVNSVTMSDIADAFGQGLSDFRAAPAFGLFFGAVYALAGVGVVACAWVLELSYIAYPLAAGFALIGPFVAVGLYEVSRRLDAGAELSWSGVLGVMADQRGRELGWMSFVTLFVLIMWMYQVRLLMALFLGLNIPVGKVAFIEYVVSTPEGISFLVVGHAVGAVLSLILFSLTVVSFPILLDRDIDFITAMITSVKSVLSNPVPMIAWAAIVVFSLIAAMTPSFLGLLVVLPVLGHTTWHLYKKLVPPAAAD
jgi:uncharacterized membrane protein